MPSDDETLRDVSSADLQRARARLDVWRRSLLDLSQRNRLLYFSQGRATRVQIGSPDPTTLYRTLAADEAVLTFPHVQHVKPEAVMDADPDEAATREERVVPGDLVPIPSVASFDDLRRLYLQLERLRKNTRTLSEEQGVHTLYIALGLLEWREAPASQETIRSPLVLVPVRLEKDVQRYKLSPHDDAVEENPALAFRLEHDFALTLPGLADFEGTDSVADVTAYLSAVEDRVRQSAWRVLRESWLAQFAFYKLAMYRDLGEAHVAESAARHSVLSVLCDLRGTERPQPIDQQEADRHHSAPAGFPVLDADSSQLEVLERVRRGQNLVVQGPPGTGKSQTIVNIIAQAIRRGQRVLFVSEKRAALEIVHHRLKLLSLDRACLELHSHRANRKDVVTELMRATQYAPSWGEEPRQDMFDDYRRSKDRLEQYVQALHQPHGKISLTAYEIHGRLAMLAEIPTIHARLPMETVLAMTAETPRALRDAVAELSASPLWGNTATHPFRDAEPVDGRAWIPEIVQGAAERLSQASATLHAAMRSLAEDLGLPTTSVLSPFTDAPGAPPATFAADVPTAMRVLEYLRSRPLVTVPHAWLVATDGPLLRMLALTEDAAGQAVRVASALDASAQMGAPAISDHLEAVGTLLDAVAEAQRFRLLARWRFVVHARGLLRLAGAHALRLRHVFPVLVAAADLRVGRSWFATHDGDLRMAFGPLYVGLETNFTQIRETLHWIERLPKEIGTVWSDQLSLGRDPLLTALSTGSQACAPQTLERRLQDLKAKVATYHMCTAELAPLFSHGVAGRTFDNLPLAFVSEQTAMWIRQAYRLPEWLTYARALSRCTVLGLSEFIAECQAKHVPATMLERAFERALFLRWKQEIYSAMPVLAEFDGLAHQAMVERFRALDKKLQAEAVKATLRAVSTAIPRDLPQLEESRLRREYAKKARLLPLRRLLPSIPRLLLAHKPCLLMSPLSVAVYLPHEVFAFDIVVFDEASQLPPADAIGAILRGRQVVIFGDNKQLPPSDFFQAHAEEPTEADEADGQDAAAYESILDLATLLPQARLLWHYRSLDERLIAFSNTRFYDGTLITFPAPSTDIADMGVRLEYVADGIYARGGARTNPREAQRVVDLIVEHFQTHPERSLGVITMNIEQRDLVERELQRRLEEHPDLAPLAAEDRAPTPFFVKNLETVQGDERHDIIISIGYGPSEPGGVPTLQFGPLNRNGGERRWNVAVTRAQCRTTVVTSMRPEQLDGVQASQRQGPKEMRAYLEYASRGGWFAATAQGTAEPQSDFEEAVRDALLRRGYTVDCQVGSSGFRVDLGIRHPDYLMRYILGIECDGKMYHSATTARDRDRLRQAILESRGWVLHRVWSTDWSANPQAALERIVAKVEEHRRRGSMGVITNIPDVTDLRSGVSREDTSTRDSEDPPLATPSITTEKPTVRFMPYTVYEAQRETRLAGIPGHGGRQFAKYAIEAINTESPVHEDLVVKRLMLLAGYDRRGNRLVSGIRGVLRWARDAGRVERRGSFWWKAHSGEVTPRSAMRPDRVDPDHIAPEEWDSAVVTALKQLGAASRNAVAHGVAEGFEYRNVTAATRTAVADAVARLCAIGRVVERDDLLYLAKMD